MNLKTYQAFSMSEALAAVKRDLGADAVILNTRTFKRGGVLGVGRRTIVEVTATPAGQQKPLERPLQPPRFAVKAAVAQRAYAHAAPSADSAPAVPKASALSAAAAGAKPPSPDQERRRTQRLAMALQEAQTRSSVAAAPASPVTLTASQVVVPKNTVLAMPPASTAKRFLLKSTEHNAIASRPHSQERAGAATAVIDRPDSKSVNRAMQDELSAIKTMVGQVLQRQTGLQGDPTMPKQLFDLYLKMIGQDISDELADQIAQAVRDELEADELESETAVRTCVLRHLAELIPVAQHAVPDQTNDGRPLTVALIGPTGVGKTTTLAKLAASFKLRHGKKVGLVTSDTYRIAAVEQLRTYANIIGLPLQVALTPNEMRHAIGALAGCEVILIDTAGRSQNDSNRLCELKQFITAANPHEVHLVLAGTAGEKVLMREAEAFATVGVHKIVLTKLDEAVSFGMLINVIRRVGKQLSFVTTGQEVPTHLEVGRAERLAELVLGAKVRG